LALIFYATEKENIVFRHTRNFVMSAAVMLCSLPSMTDAHVKKAQKAAQRRYAEKEDDHLK